MNKEVIITFIIIFSLRILDTSLSTLSTMFTSQGNKKLAPIFGFLQTITWITGLSIVMKKLDDPRNLFVYALAYGIGIFLGIKLEEKIASGNVVIQAVIEEDKKEIIKQLRDKNLIVTVIDGQGKENQKRLILFIAIERKRVNEIKKFLRDNKIFMTISKSDIFLNI